VRRAAVRRRTLRSSGSVKSCLYEGTVRHRRRWEVGDEFSYPLFMAYLDLDELPELFDGHWLWSARRPALAWFHRADYLGDPSVPLAAEVRALMRERTGAPAEGPIRLLTHMRCFGHCFNPVSFYYCFDRAGERVRAVVADVTNTPWGERHSYVMEVAQAADRGSARLMSASLEKQLHVSPLMSMEHVYDWRLTEPGERLSVHIESRRTGDRAGTGEGVGESVFDATLSLARVEMDGAHMRGMLVRYPLLSARIVARIYAHALRLRVRGASWFPHPGRPSPAPGGQRGERAVGA
jgi:uncharacterized protein